METQCQWHFPSGDGLQFKAPSELKLVGGDWNMAGLRLSILIGNGIIISTDFHIFRRGRYTTNQIVILMAVYDHKNYTPVDPKQSFHISVVLFVL